jgi:hypothetical protein
MRVICQWIAIALIVIMLIISDAEHLATIRFNVFISLLLGAIAGLVILLKITHQHQPDKED